MPASETVRITLLQDLYPCVMPAAPADDPIEFHACSHGRGGQAFIDNAPFRSFDDRLRTEEGRRILCRSSAWLYQPVDFSAALSAHGIHNRVFCHSGRTVVDGEYVD